MDISQLVHEYDDGVVMFDPTTSNTTLFNPIVMWLIKTVATSSFDQQSILTRLITDYSDDNSDDLALLLDNTLASLLKLGFIQRI